MSESFFYPELGDAYLLPLKVIKEQLQAHPGYLAADACPYSKETKKWLAEALTVAADPSKDLALLPVDLGIWSQVEREVVETYNETKSVYTKLTDSETSEKISALRLRSASLKHLVELQERAANLAKFHAFLETILNFVEGRLGVEARDELLNLIEAKK